MNEMNAMLRSCYNSPERTDRETIHASDIDVRFQIGNAAILTAPFSSFCQRHWTQDDFGAQAVQDRRRSSATHGAWRGE